MITKKWSFIPLAEVLERVRKPVSVTHNAVYKEIGIRSHGKGIFYKEPKTGESLGNKSVFWIEPDCFILNIVFAWEQAIGLTTINEKGMIASHRFPMYKPKPNFLSLDYLLYFFMTPRGKYLLELASPGGAGRNKTLGQAEFLKLEILLPPLPEQRKIVEILSSWDKAIALLEQLITAKRKLKQGLMQQLLTGKKRFKEFEGSEWDMIPEGWEETTIEELLKKNFLLVVQDGNHGNDHPKASDYVKDGIPFVMARDLTSGTINFSSCSFISPKQAKNLRVGFSYPGDILLSHKGTIGEVAKVPNNYDYVILTPQVTCYRVNPKSDFSSDYLYQYFLSSEFQSILDSWSSQSTRDYIGITQQKKLPIKYPPLPEQQKIASILSTADTEISNLEKQLAAYKQQKRGLMQQLLTGKKRVKIDEPQMQKV